jgi:hypothetical protein
LNDLSCCTSCFHMPASQHSSVQKSSEPCSKSSPNTGPFCAASRCFAGYLLQNVHTFVAILFILSPIHIPRCASKIALNSSRSALFLRHIHSSS